MGAFLEKPKTEKTNISGEGNGIRYGMSSMQGWRICMEDAHIAETTMSTESPYKNWSFFAVFDGHAGSQIAAVASAQILKHLISTEQFNEMTKLLEGSNGVLTPKCLELIEAGIKKGFLSFDENSKTNTECNKSGTTAVCAIVTPTHVIIGNLGDSRAVISTRDADVFGTQDHKPYLEHERKRIEDAGGSVMIQRINGSLAVSRAFGDYEYKEHPLLPAERQLVSPEPDVYIRERNLASDEFMVLACDGVYDVMENEELAQFVRGRLQVTKELTQVCDDVLDECLNKGSRDNMTAVVVLFPSAPEIEVQRQEAEKKWVEEVLKAIHEIVDETISAEDYGSEDLVNVRSIMEKLDSNDLVRSTPIGTPAHLINSLIARTLKEREIKHM